MILNSVILEAVSTLFVIKWKEVTPRIDLCNIKWREITPCIDLCNIVSNVS